MKRLAICLLLLSACAGSDLPDLEQVEWIHGSADCASNEDPSIQVLAYGDDTWIMRQNKCQHYEAPFIYLFRGSDKSLLVDTGAPFGNQRFPLDSIVRRLIGKEELVVMHTHAHGDHHAGDEQFKGKPSTTVVDLKAEDVAQFFGLTQWPEGSASFELGDRTITIFPIPGHDPASVAVYDPVSKLLLTGDTFYPGRLYVRDYPAFRNSIEKIAAFCAQHEVTWLAGNHIEMAMKFQTDYPVGTTYQPDEHALPLRPFQLTILRDSLRKWDSLKVNKVFDEWVVVPVVKLAQE